jgi:hypothetical protein
MKHILLYENFDLDKFMENPDEFFHDDSSPEIEEGDYVTSYRGTGQVLDIGPVFATLQLIDGPETQVKVPIENVTKITREEAMNIIKNKYNSQREIKGILDELQKFSDTVGMTPDDEDDESMTVNLKATVDYLEEILTDIISLKRRDPHTTSYQDYGNLVSLVARIAHFVMDQSQEDDELEKRVASILDKFYEISE